MKSNKILKMISIACVLAILTSMTACSGDSSGKDTSDTASNTSDTGNMNDTGDTGAETENNGKSGLITITTVVSLDDTMQAMVGTNPDVATNNNWYNGYKEDLGIEVVNVWSVPATQYDDKLNAQIAADDLPDVFKVTADQLKTLVENGMVMDMTQVFSDYASDFTLEMMEADDQVGLSQATYDGKLMALPCAQGNTGIMPVMWIRRDWMDKLGYEAPKTMKELEALALAFVTEDPDENGADDSYGIALSNDLYSSDLCDLTGVFAGFEAYPEGWIEQDGSIVSGFIQPEVKNALETMSVWYQEGIFDPEFIAKDSSKVAEDIISGKVGISFGSHWNAFWPFQDAYNYDMEADWVPYALPTETGELAQIMVNGSAVDFYAVNVKCENPEAVVEMFNYFYAKDCALSPDYDSTFHITSSLQLSNPEQSFVWAVIKTNYAEQNTFIHRGLMAYFNGDETQIENPWVSDNVINVEKFQEDPIGNSMHWSDNMWSGPEGAFSIVNSYIDNKQTLQNLYILGNTEGMSQYKVTLDQLTEETYTKIISGSLDISSFDDYVTQWKALGGDEITAEVNEAISN